MTACLVWVTNQITSAQLDAGKGEPDADPNMDGTVNIDEFLSGTDVIDIDFEFILDMNLSGRQYIGTQPSIASRPPVSD